MAQGGKSVSAHVSEEKAEEIERAADRRNESTSQFVKQLIDDGLYGRTALEEWAKDFALILVALSVFMAVFAPDLIGLRAAALRAGALFVVGGTLALGVQSGAVAWLYGRVGGLL